MAIILKTSAIRSTPKGLRREVPSSFDITSESEEVDNLFLQLAVMFKMKKKKERKINYWAPEFFRKREEKEAFNNLKRNETGR